MYVLFYQLEVLKKGYYRFCDMNDKAPLNKFYQIPDSKDWFSY